MNKSAILCFMFALMISISFASAVPQASVPTVVAGRIVEINNNALQYVHGAEVTVECEGSTLTDTSDDLGRYSVIFYESACTNDTVAYVTAVKDGKTGTNQGLVRNHIYVEIAIVDVLLQVPEFSAITAGVALLGAGIGFVYLRKRK